MSKHMTVTVAARDYEDEDDSLSAAAEEVSRELGLREYDLDARWGDDDRETIELTIPRPGSNDAQAWDRLRNLDCISAVSVFTAANAAEYVQGWDSYDAIAATAAKGVAEADLDQLADAGYDPEQAAQVLRDYCRDRVTNG